MEKKKLIIFGLDDMASIAHFYFKHDSEYDVCCFTVDEKYMKTDRFCGLKVIPFENIEKSYPIEYYDMFIAMGYSKLNRSREKKYLEAKNKGYKLATYLSSKATYWEDIDVGENCFILEDNTIQPFVHIKDNVVLWSGNHIGHHVTIGNHTFISSHVVVSGRCQIGNNCFVGVNATINDHIKIEDYTIIGSGALITKDTESGLYKAASTKKSDKEINDVKYFKF